MTKLTADQYQKWTRETYVGPSGESEELNYLILGLLGECGELANKAKKLLYRDNPTPQLLKDTINELGDCQWYLARIADVLGISLSSVMFENKCKLEGRAKRGTLHGSGDRR